MEKSVLDENGIANHENFFRMNLKCFLRLTIDRKQECFRSAGKQPSA